MDEKSRKLFHKEESELSDYERMMLEIVAAKEAAEENAPVEEPPAEEALPAEEPAPAAAPDEGFLFEEVPAERPPLEELFEAEEAAAPAPVEEEISAPESPAPAEEPPAPAPEAPAPADEPDDSDVKIAAQTPPEKKEERIPLLVEEKNPELEPVVVNRPTIQFMNSIEREKKITQKVRRHRRRSGVVVMGLCVALILVAFLYNGFVNKSWGILEKTEPTPEPTTEVVEIAPTPAPTPEPTPEPVKEHRFVVQRADLSWVGAQDLCLSSGGYLAVINTREEFDRITALADEQGIEALWIGCRRDIASNSFVWEHAETVDPDVDPNSRQMSLWADGEPSFIDDEGTAEDYLLLWNHDGRWSYWDSIGDLTIYYGWRGRIGYVCEFEA